MQINTYFQDQPLFGGVFSNNEFINPDPHKIYILNLENNSEGGSHWVLWYNYNYFDSYGVVPTKQVSKYTKEYHIEGFQSLSQSSCGYYCMFVADNIIAGRPPTEGLIEDQPHHNEKVLDQYFKLHTKSPL